MANRGRSSYERRTNICLRRGSEKRGSASIPQYTSRRIWREMENNRVGYKKLLVVRSYEESKEIYG